MMTTLKVIAFVLLVLWCATCPAATRGDAVGEAERIEDLRLLHYYGIAEVHKAKALAIYLQGWGGPDRRGDVETLMQEAEDVYGALVAADRGAQALLVGLEAGGDAAPSEGQLELVRRARCSAASEVRAFYQRCRALRDELAREVNQVAIQKVKWQVVSRPEPWNDPAREADRAAGHQRGCNMRDGFFEEPAEVTDYAFTKFAKAGLSYCLTGYDPACNWGRIETAPGAYDFSKLDAMLDRLTRGGLRTCLMLNTLCGDPPAWHRERHGDECTLAAPANAQAGKPAVRRGINLFHKETGDAFARFLTAYAAHLKERSAAQVDAIFVQSIQGWEQSEIEAPVHESQAMDAFWKEWSKTDVPWRTPESILKDEHPGEAAVARAEMCREAWLHEYVRRVTAALKQGWPGVRVQSLTVNDDFHWLMNTAYTGRSHNARELCGLTDNPSSAASSPASLSLYRSLAGGRWLWSWGTHSGGGTTAGADFAHQPFFDVSRISFFSALGHLVRMRYPANWYRYQDGQLGGFGLGSYAMTHRRVQEFGPVLLNTAIPRADVAILWSQSTRRRDRSRHLLRETLGWGHLLKRTNVHYDYVAEDDLAATLPGCKLLILPNAQSLPAAACDAIRAWVQEGGIVLGSGAPGLYDEFGTRRDSLPLADVFGADVARMRVPAPITPDKLETSHPEGAYCPKPPVDYKFKADLTAALKPLTGKPRAWFAGTENDVAIVENAFGKGGAVLSGFPIGHEYWESAPYEMAFGLTHFRACNYNYEQVRYEEWIVKELANLGIGRKVTLPGGDFLRGQFGNDPDWENAFRNGPEYNEMFIEHEQPVRTATAFFRTRDGIDNLYVGIAHTEAHHSSGRGYFRMTLTGAEITASVDAPGGGTVVFDALLGVPVASRMNGKRLEFATWVPLSQSSMFAVAPGGSVRLFGEPQPTGIGPDELLTLASAHAKGGALRDVEVIDADRIKAYVRELRGKKVVIACGDTRFRAAGDELAGWLRNRYEADVRVTAEFPRLTCKPSYMDSFGWPQCGPDPVQADVLIGNCQDNGLMWKFVRHGNNSAWLPIEVNQNFPGTGRAVLMMSSPVLTAMNGTIAPERAAPQLVIGASFPSEAMLGVKTLQKMKP